ncbi:MAG: SDR family NAD(P)-dependent oxidoreductase [Bacteroidota bacterium]
MPETFALITGGSSGIGLEIAKLLAARGYSLLLVSNQEEQLNQLKEELSSQHKVRVETVCINLARSEAASEVFNFCQQKNLEVEVLVNNAGFFFFGQITDADTLKAQAKIHLHILTSSLLCTLFGNEMRKRRKGFILNNSSISAYKEFPGIGYYGATKSYIKSFTRSLRTELKFYGVNVTCLCPGATATNLYDPNVIDVELGKKLGIMMSAEKVAKLGVQGLFNDKAVVIPGFMTKLMLFLALLTPQWVIYEIRKRTKYLK